MVFQQHHMPQSLVLELWHYLDIGKPWVSVPWCLPYPWPCCGCWHLQVITGVPPLQRERMAQLLMGGTYLRQLLDLFRVGVWSQQQLGAWKQRHASSSYPDISERRKGNKAACNSRHDIA
jgi:hypothetical protein